jgi:trehalose-phosphatase
MARSELESKMQFVERDIQWPRPWTAFATQQWWEQLASYSHSILMLDYDGTLSPFVQDRMEATLYPGVGDRLFRLAQHPRVHLIFISGRPARELASLLPSELKAEIWGAHGCEHLLADGSMQVEPLTPAQTASLGWLEDSIANRGFRAAIEKKSGSLAFHTRSLTDDEGRQLRELVHILFAQREAVAGPSAELELLSFDGGIEVRGIGCSKAVAVARILQSEAGDAAAAYLGDDHTDEDAFRALDGRGLRVLVRDEARASLADVWLRPPGELLAFLDCWLTALAAPLSGPRE